MTPANRKQKLKSTDNALSRGRKFSFVLIAILLPFCFLLILEVILRIAGYGNDYPLFVEDSRNPEFLRINNEIARRYFLNPEAAPNVSFPSFRKKKNENTYRIVVQGASTVLGIPYMHGGSFPAMLEQRLRYSCKNKEIEVINTGITAVNTYTLLDLANEITGINPDAIIIYSGQNEYYGALGVASTQQLGRIQELVYLYMIVDDLRLFRLIKNIHTGIARKKSGDILLSPDQTLMQRMVREQSIPLDSKIYNAGIRQFKRNLEKLVKIYRGENIPVLIGTIVSNLKDMEPFITAGTRIEPGLNDENAEKKEFILNLVETEKDNAWAHYRAGQLFYAEKNYDQAEIMFRRAKDLDLLRFRAPEAFNKIIRENAKEWDFILVDLDSIFSSHSENGIIGNELITEHVHPNVRGYFLMADAYYSALFENKLLECNCKMPFDEAFRQIPVTHVDSMYAKLGLTVLTNSWPFRDEPFNIENLESLYAPFSFPDSLALLVFREELSWTQAMNELYRYYLENNLYEDALRVAEAMKTEYRYSGIPYNMSARVFGLQQQTGKAIDELLDGFRLDPLPEIAYNLSGYFMDSGNLEKSLYYLEYTVKHNPDFEGAKKKLDILKSAVTLNERLKSDSDNVSLMINLAKNYIMLNQLERADSLIRHAIQKDPSHPEVQLILKKITGS